MADEPSRYDSRPRLGRGLAALIGDSQLDPSSSDSQVAAKKVPIDALCPNVQNPRKTFDESELEELAESIRHRGIIQPILVRPSPNSSGKYEIVAGERRWRAAKKAGLHEAPIIILEINEREALEIGIIENVQRSDLNALDEAKGYEMLMSEHGYTQNEVSHIVGKSRSHIANTIRLLSLPERSKLLLSKGALSAGHARALLTMNDPDKVADQIIRDGLTVRDVERVRQGRVRKKRNNGDESIDGDVSANALGEKLKLALGAKVTILYLGDGGEIRIKFQNLEQLNAFCSRLIAQQDILT